MTKIKSDSLVVLTRKRDDGSDTVNSVFGWSQGAVPGLYLNLRAFPDLGMNGWVRNTHHVLPYSAVCAFAKQPCHEWEWMMEINTKVHALVDKCPRKMFLQFRLPDKLLNKHETEYRAVAGFTWQMAFLGPRMYKNRELAKKRLPVLVEGRFAFVFQDQNISLRNRQFAWSQLENLCIHIMAEGEGFTVEQWVLKMKFAVAVLKISSNVDKKVLDSVINKLIEFEDAARFLGWIK